MKNAGLFVLISLIVILLDQAKPVHGGSVLPPAPYEPGTCVVASGSACTNACHRLDLPGSALFSHLTKATCNEDSKAPGSVVKHIPVRAQASFAGQFPASGSGPAAASPRHDRLSRFHRLNV